MAKQMMANPQIRQAFLQYVDILGGAECNKWNQVADYLLQNFQYRVPHPPYLRQVWNTLQGEKEDFTTEELQDMLEICIRTRLKEANELQGRQISVRVFKRVTNRLIRKILIVMVSILSRFKRKLTRECRQITPKTIQQMLRVIDLQVVDEEIEEMQGYCRILEQLYLKFAEHITASKEKLFVELRGIVNRRQFERIIGYLQQIQELNRISNQKQQLLNHPFLKQQIEDNKQTQLYQQLIQKQDWESKYQLYNEIDKVDREEYQFRIDETKQKKRIRRTNQKKKNKNIYYRDPKTIVFEEEILGEQDEKMHQLYQDVFKCQI